MIISYNSNNSFRVRSGITPPEPGDFDSDALAYITAVEIADNQSLESGVKNAINDFVVGCKQDGIWSAIKASCILMGARTLTGCLTPLVGTAPTNNGPFVSGDYNRKTGLVGNGTSKWLNSNRAGNADPQNNQHLGVYASTAHTPGVAGAYIASGTLAGASGASDIGRSGNNTANLFLRSRELNADLAAGQGGATGFICLSRSASGSYSFRSSGSTSSITRNSQTPASNNVGVFRFGGEAAGFSSSRLAFYSIGESLDLALLDTRVTALYNAIGAAIP